MLRFQRNFQTSPDDWSWKHWGTLVNGDLQTFDGAIDELMDVLDYMNRTPRSSKLMISPGSKARFKKEASAIRKGKALSAQKDRIRDIEAIKEIRQRPMPEKTIRDLRADRERLIE